MTWLDVVVLVVVLVGDGVIPSSGLTCRQYEVWIISFKQPLQVSSHLGINSHDKPFSLLPPENFSIWYSTRKVQSRGITTRISCWRLSYSSFMPERSQITRAFFVHSHILSDWQDTSAILVLVPASRNIECMGMGCPRIKQARCFACVGLRTSQFRREHFMPVSSNEKLTWSQARSCSLISRWWLCKFVHLSNWYCEENSFPHLLVICLLVPVHKYVHAVSMIRSCPNPAKMAPCLSRYSIAYRGWVCRVKSLPRA